MTMKELYAECAASLEAMQPEAVSEKPSSEEKASQKFGAAVDDRGEKFYKNPGTRLFLTPKGDAGVGPAPMSQ